MAVTDLTNTKWLINSVTCTAGYGSFDINYTCSTEGFSIDCDEIYIGYRPNIDGSPTPLANNVTIDELAMEMLNVGWTMEITGGTDVTNANLISWLTANATQITSNIVEVTYNNSTILSTSTTGTYTLPTANKYMSTDIVITANDLTGLTLSATYNGNTILSTSSTGTYTLSTAGKYMATNVVIELAEAVQMPVKGDLINIDITGDGTTSQFRVLEVNGTQAKLLAMTSAGTSAFNTSSTTTTFDNGSTGQKYQGSTLDDAMTGYYNAMSANIKNAIIAQNRIQMKYTYSDTQPSSYTYSFQDNWSASNYNYATLTDQVTIGSRYCFALDVKEIFDYFEKTAITSNELNTMFFNQTTASNERVWLCSAGSVARGAWYVEGSYGRLNENLNTKIYAVHPAFVIDLSNISWS